MQEISEEAGENETDYEQGPESIITKLKDFVYSKIKHSDFTNLDRKNLMEVFLTHPTSLLKLYELIFPQGNNKLKLLEKSAPNYHDDMTYFITEQPIHEATKKLSTAKNSCSTAG